MAERKRAVLIAGPTASGKSALALDLARARGAAIVNADSMQVYEVLNVLTARPGPEALGAAAHRLYGFVSPAERFSVGAWAGTAKDVIARERGELIFVGGTGLYFEALCRGVVAAPEVAAKVVAAVEADVAPLDRGGRAALLAERDPAMAAVLKEPDRQRVVRALSVLAATGRSLAEWQSAARAPLLDGFELEKIVLWPEREPLRDRIAARFEAMLDAGAVGEVKALRAMGLDPSLPAMKAIGVRQIGAWLDGEISRDEAVAQAVNATRQYAKRQRTWFRKHMADWDWRSQGAPSRMPAQPI